MKPIAGYLRDKARAYNKEGRGLIKKARALIKAARALDGQRKNKKGNFKKA